MKKKAKAAKAKEEGGGANTMAPQPDVQISAAGGGLNKAPTANRAFQGTITTQK